MVTNGSVKRTAFYDFHVKRGGRMVEYAGWEMPLLYQESGIIGEHEHTRSAASIFDVSHMGRLKITGKDATGFLDRVCTRNVEKGAVGQSLYSLVCRDDGGVLDDVIVSRYESHWLMVCNAGNREKILGWLAEAKGGMQVRVEDETFTTSMVAVQGPKVMGLLDELLPSPASGIKRYHFETQRYMMMIQFGVFRSGYTGEDGVEIILGNTAAAMAINFLAGDDGAKAVLKPAGLGARDTLRLEAGMPLYGHELSEEGDPISAGLGWAVDLKKEFIGAAALRKVAEAGPRRVLAGLFVEGQKAARQGMAVKSGGREVGVVTSGAMSPTLKRCIAIAYVERELNAVGTELVVDVRGNEVKAVVTSLPFYKRAKT